MNKHKNEISLGLANYRGFTISEILISLALSSILMTSIMHIFLTIKQIFVFQQGMIRIQENIQSSSIILGDLIRGAGYFGCNRLNQYTIFSNLSRKLHTSLGLNRISPVQIIHFDELINFPNIYNRIQNKVSSHSDILWIQTLTKVFTLKDFVYINQDYIDVMGHASFKSGDLIILSDCQTMELLRIKKMTYSNIPQESSRVYFELLHNQTSLSKVFQPLASVGKLDSVLIYVGDTMRKNQHGDRILALYQTNLNGRTLELIEGIRQFKAHSLSSNELKSTDQKQTIQVNLIFDSIERVYQSLGNKLKKDPRIKIHFSQEWAIRSSTLNYNS